jgi:hypothetical protein
LESTKEVKWNLDADDEDMKITSQKLLSAMAEKMMLMGTRAPDSETTKREFREAVSEMAEEMIAIGRGQALRVMAEKIMATDIPATADEKTGDEPSTRAHHQMGRERD